MPETTLCEGRIVLAGAKTHFQTIADSIRFLCVLWPPNSKIPFEYWFQPICKVRIDRFMITIKKRDGKKDLKPLTTNHLNFDPSPIGKNNLRIAPECRCHGYHYQEQQQHEETAEPTALCGSGSTWRRVTLPDGVWKNRFH